MPPVDKSSTGDTFIFINYSADREGLNGKVTGHLR